MVTEVILPKMGMAMEEGTLTKWLVEEGQRIELGQSLCELTTDKVEAELEAEVAGYIARLMVAEGETVDVGAPIALMVESEDELEQAQSRVQGDSQPSSIQPAGGSHTDSVEALTVAVEGGSVGRPQVHNDPKVVGDPSSVLATPAARQLAKNLGINLATLEGAADRKMLTAEDVKNAVEKSGDSLSREPGASKVSDIVARRMTESFASPHFYLSAQLDATSLLDRARTAKEEGELAPTVTDLLLYITSRTLLQHRKLNCLWDKGQVSEQSQVNAGFAVDSKRGLVVPVIRDIVSLRLPEMVQVRQELTDRARSGKLRPEDIERGTWTLSNLGMYEVDAFHAILNPPQAMILAAGRVKNRPWVEAERVVVRSTLNLTLSGDHRVIDGATGARFIEDLKRNLESCEL